MRQQLSIVIGIIVGGLIALNLLAQGLDHAVSGSEPSGAHDSSYATTDTGLAAYATLLTRFGHPVTQLRGKIPDFMSGDRTVVVIEPTALTDDESAALLQFVTNGGRLVIGGTQPFYLKNLRDRPPRWSATGLETWQDADSSLGNVQSIASAAAGSFIAPGSGRVLVGTDERALVTSDSVGQGEMLFLADPSPLENAYLARADNAAFAVALAGPAEQPVFFAEGTHGYGESRGWRAIPTRWKYALLLVAVAALAFVWSRARRFGPPDRAARDLPPARAEYVRALSKTLERTRNRAGALAPLQQWALERGAHDDVVERPITNDDDVLALGRAVADVSTNDRSLG